jgi:hypothetical protein
LSRVRLDWQANEDRTYNGGKNNRGRVYVDALIPVAVELIRLDRIKLGTTEPVRRTLSAEEAESTILDVNNWWRYRLFEGLNDPLDPGLAPDGLVGDTEWMSPFWLHQANHDRWHVSSWSRPPLMERLLG